TRNNNLWITQSVAPCVNPQHVARQPVAQPPRQPRNLSFNLFNLLKLPACLRRADSELQARDATMFHLRLAGGNLLCRSSAAQDN
ncbi:hypothetical protein SFRURICE_005291, partial [Spodoptera frugiperda]